MQIISNEPLSLHSTMRLGGSAKYAVEVHDRAEIAEAIHWARQRNLEVLVIGIGSNIVWRDQGFEGLLIINKVSGYDTYNEDDENYYLTVGGGEIWDSVVSRSVQDNLTGIECLSLIPGTAGATPVQNVGAYGQEISQTLVSVEVCDLETAEFITIPASDCAFGYRTSRFKTTDRNRYLISSITLHLLHANPMPPFYSSLQQYLTDNGVTDYTSQNLRNAVIAIRQSKLPDPAQTSNNGSFFANPVVSKDQFRQLQLNISAVPHWPLDNGDIKIPAAWLIEQSGFKDYHDSETGMATWPSQPLVIVNERAKTTADLLRFKEKITSAVKNKFGIELVQEPEILP